MTLDELKERCKKAEFQYAYGSFKRPIAPPHLVAVSQASNNFFADNIVFQKDIPIKLDYTYIEKDTKAQAKIEDEILKDIAWNKTDETYLSDEKIWQVSYFFEI